MTHQELQTVFQNTKGIDEAKRLYRLLAKSLHPDMGGDEESFKILNEVYTNFIEQENKQTNKSFDIELEKIISKLLHYEDITIEVIGKWIWLSGNTKAIKERLKELSFKWANKKKMWYYGKMKKRTKGGKVNG